MIVGMPFQEISRAGRWSLVAGPSHNPGRIQAEGEHGLTSHLCTTWPPGCATCDRLSRLVPNFPQPQPCWPLSTQGPHATLLDGESRWWCCGISLRYAWRRHLARKHQPRSSSARACFHREHGSLGAARGPASLEVNNSASDTNHAMDTMRVLVLWLPTVWGLGAVRMVAAPPLPLVPSDCHPPPTKSPGIEPGPPACKSPTTNRVGPHGSTVALGVAELRNRDYGTGHGRAGAPIGLRPRHAHLAVNASITWCRLMLDTLGDPEAPWVTASSLARSAEKDSAV